MASDWLADYVRYTKNQESPEAFHFWTGLTVLGAAVGRRVWLDRGVYKIFPGQIMTILVAGSAKLRKSTCAKIGINMLKESKTVTIISGKNSPEAFIDALDQGQHVVNGAVLPKDSHAIVFASELASFLSKQAYTDALIPILTDLADAPNNWDFKTRGHGTRALRNVCLSFLGASTPDWLAEAIPDNAFGGGFMSRILFVYQDKTPRYNAFPTKGDFDEDKRAELILQLADFGKLSGPIEPTAEAREFYSTWYKKYFESPDSDMDGYWGRKPDHILRVGMCLSIACGLFPHLGERELRDALRHLEAVEALMPYAFRYVGASPLGKEQENLIRVMHKLGGTATLQELMTTTWRKMDVTTLRQALETLKAAGMITEHVHGNHATYFLVDKA